MNDSVDVSSVEQGSAGQVTVELGGVVETALAEALSLAARAGQWTTVELLARELEARRVRRDEAAAVDNVVALPRGQESA